MHAILAVFRPAEWVISRLRFANKFWLIEAVFVAPIVLLLLMNLGVWQPEGMMRTLVLLMVIGFVLLGGYLFTGATLSIRKALNQLVDDTRQLADGQLGSRVALEVDDELSDVAASFNKMAGNMADVIRQGQQMLAEVSVASEQLASANEQLSESAETQSEAASAMAAAVEQITQSIANVADYAVQADGLARNAQQVSAEGQTVVLASVHEVEQIAAVMDETSRTVNQLGESSAQITQILGVIREIADQTNLLALNAAIEAARAGEVGRGFAVVADEVRKLAERTSAATGQIGGMINEIRHETERAVACMQDGNQRLQEGVQLAREAGETMERIKSGATDVVRTVSDIAAGSMEQRASSNELAQNIETIAEKAGENADSVKRARVVSQSLQKEMRALNAVLSRFKVS
ncbi:methyl-accepting chemotaxis protein [Leeia aquatica]|uniref:Methyl-accepting chemotaxis protein n=1 Tax=Leeia aquatica TaxID=2725557 RepID=A0A847SAM3_9NEIS|nr:methyl-accepting chemotaxis protein [Leeia aquatica]NLR74586.1 methyl-accepting chemotaxis protein [Leeia aquatica]